MKHLLQNAILIAGVLFTTELFASLPYAARFAPITDKEAHQTALALSAQSACIACFDPSAFTRIAVHEDLVALRDDTSCIARGMHDFCLTYIFSRADPDGHFFFGHTRAALISVDYSWPFQNDFLETFGRNEDVIFALGGFDGMILISLLDRELAYMFVED
ncbi:MAG: hypothetical protein AAFY43_10275 [Pseudomonadota bacterium]